MCSLKEMTPDLFTVISFPTFLRREIPLRAENYITGRDRTLLCVLRELGGEILFFRLSSFCFPTVPITLAPGK